MRQSLEQWVGTSRILSLVFTDVVDSTRLASALGDELWIEVEDSTFIDRLFALLFDDLVYFLPRFFDKLFDLRRLDAAVEYEILERETRDLPSDRIE